MGKTEKDEKDPRKILEVDVNEVSLVDRAANLRKFLVIKRLKEDKKMGAFQAEVEKLLAEGKPFKDTFAKIEEIVKSLPESDGEPGAFWESENEEIMKALPEDLAKAIRETSSWLKRMGGMKGAPSKAISRVLTFLGKVVGGKYPYPKPAAKAEDILSEEEAKKLITEELSKAIESVTEFLVKAANGELPIPDSDTEEVAKAMPEELKTSVKSVVQFLTNAMNGKYPYPKPGEEDDEAKKKKAAAKKSNTDDPDAQPGQPDPNAETPAVQVMDDGTVIVKGQPVSKGKKFTPSRTEAIKEVALSLIKLLGEVGDENTRKALGEALKSFEPATDPAPATPTQKSADPIPEVVELKKQLADVTEKLEKVLKERKAGASTEDDPQHEPVKKNDDDLWGNII